MFAYDPHLYLVAVLQSYLQFPLAAAAGNRRSWFPLIIMYRLNGPYFAAGSRSFSPKKKHCLYTFLIIGYYGRSAILIH